MLPSWVGVVSAISLAIIALAALVGAGAIVAAALGIRTAVKALKNFAGPAIADVRQLIGSIKTEADALVGASRDVRQRIVRAADAAEERLTDLDALAEVLQDELEETALDAAVRMRDVRRGLSVWRWGGIVTRGTSARRSSIWRQAIRCAPSASAISRTSPPTPSPTTSSSRASSSSRRARSRSVTPTGRADSRRIWVMRTRAKRATSS